MFFLQTALQLQAAPWEVWECTQNDTRSSEKLSLSSGEREMSIYYRLLMIIGGPIIDQELTWRFPTLMIEQFSFNTKLNLHICRVLWKTMDNCAEKDIIWTNENYGDEYISVCPKGWLQTPNVLAWSLLSGRSRYISKTFTFMHTYN